MDNLKPVDPNATAGATNFWEEEYTDFVPDVTIKFRKMSALDVLDLADRNVGRNSDSKEFKKDCLQNVIWSKGDQWFQLMDDDGNVTIPNLRASVLMDIFHKFRSTVCLPVFLESRAYQILSESKAEAAKGKKTNKG